MDMPDTCNCGAINMIDWLNLEARPVSKLLWVEGYTCQDCQRWKPLFYSSRLLDESMKKLTSMPPTHKSFAYLLSKAVRRAADIQLRERQ